MIGRRLSHYRILEQIGLGGMGVVYRALDERLHREVALNVLPPGLLENEAARRRFRLEAHALSRLSNPLISTILDFDTDGGYDFLVLEYVPGVTLAQKLASGPLPLTELVDVGRQIARGLEGAHERGVTHRDLKPGNVMVTPKGWIKILDFGLAKLSGEVDDPSSLIQTSLTESNAVVGTMPYMAPEQLQGQAVDGRTDLHALGAILYEMATGVRAFSGDTVGNLVDAVLHRRPPPPSTLRPEVDPDFDRLVSRALEKDPERRYQSAGEMERALEALQSAGGTATVRGVGAARSRRRALTLGAGAVVLLAGVVALQLGGARLVLDRLAPGPRYDGIAVLPFQNLSGDPGVVSLSERGRGVRADPATIRQTLAIASYRSSSLVDCPCDSLTKSTDRFEDRVGRRGPGERMAAMIVVLDEVLDLGNQIANTLEGAASNGALRDDVEPDLDLVEP